MWSCVSSVAFVDEPTRRRIRSTGSIVGAATGERLVLSGQPAVGGILRPSGAPMRRNATTVVRGAEPAAEVGSALWQMVAPWWA